MPRIDVRPVRVRKAEGRGLEQGLVWVEVYLPFDLQAFAAFSQVVKANGGDVVKAATADPEIASKALTPIDAHGEAMIPADLQKLAHGFLVESRQIDVLHDTTVRKSVAVVESFLNTPEIGSPQFYPGAWVVCLRLEPDSAEWKAVDSGALDAVSFQTDVFKTMIAAA